MRAFLCFFIVLLSAAARAADNVEIIIHDKNNAAIMPGRVHLYDSAGKPVNPNAGALPFFKNHFACDGRAQLSLPAGDYSYEIERGPEFSQAKGTFKIEGDAGKKIAVDLERLVDMTAEGWWPGETHVHRPVKDIELLMRSEDLHFAPVITWWNGRNEWAKRPVPENPLVCFDQNRYCHIMGGEDERGGGALLYFNIRAPLDITAAVREYPSSMKYLKEARQLKGVWVDIEKPFWWDVPMWLASDMVDSIGLANNHMCRSEMSETEAWGKPRDTQRLPPPTGNGYWTQELYYQILNTGIRIPPSAGSASGVLPNPPGYNRIYVQCDKQPDWDKWWEGIRAGRTFITNGPLLRCTANGKLPGHVFKAEENVSIKLDAKITSRDPLTNIEIVHNGKVERVVPFADWQKTGSLGEITFNESGWFMIRTIVDNPKTFRFASTAPFYVEIGGNKHRVSKAASQFFLDWTRERMGRIKLEDPAQQDEVIQALREAEEFWKSKVKKANAE